MKYNRVVLLALLILVGTTPAVRAQSVINLGAASGFAVLAGSTVTNTGSTVITGDLGVSPGTSSFGLPGVVYGTIYSGDATAASAESAAAAAYNTLNAETGTANLSGQNLGARTLTTGVYSFSGAAQLTGVLVLDGGGNSNARFDFLIGSTLTTASSSQIVFINGAQADNVYWDVGTSATIGTNTQFAGNLLAVASITFNTGASADGRLLALNGAVTLDNNAISVPTASVPEPAATSLAVAGCLGLLIIARRIRRRGPTGNLPSNHSLT